MAEEKGQLHHCERCAAVFHAPVKVGLKVVCSECGESPVVSQGFVSRAQAERLVDTDEVHGVAGKDLADFVSMQKLRRQKQARMAIILWAVLLVTVPAAIFYLKGKQREEIETLITQNKEERQERNLEKAKEIKAVLRSFDQYMEKADANHRSAFVVGGVRQILKLQADIADLSVKRLTRGAKLEQVEYYPDGEKPRVEIIALDEGDKRFELVFWKIEGEWKFDWEQYVRYSPRRFKEFLYRKEVGDSAEFCLYVRRRYSASMKPNQDLQLLFYQPLATLGDRTMESPEVVLTSGDPMYHELSAAFEKLKKQKHESPFLVGSEDLEGLLRVRATLSFAKGENGEPQLSLDKLTAYHWMAFDPAEPESAE